MEGNDVAFGVQVGHFLFFLGNQLLILILQSLYKIHEQWSEG